MNRVLSPLQLRELDALSDEQQREAMQRLVDEVSGETPRAPCSVFLPKQLRRVQRRHAPLCPAVKYAAAHASELPIHFGKTSLPGSLTSCGWRSPCNPSRQVHAAGIEPGEDRSLRRQLRQLDGRRAAAERSRLVSVGLGGGGEGGIAEALREVQLQVRCRGGCSQAPARSTAKALPLRCRCVLLRVHAQ